MAEWMTTTRLFDEGIIPASFKGKIMEMCPYDGLPILRDINLKDARCANIACFGHIRMRAVRMFSKLGVKNLGMATCGDMLQRYGCTYHFELIPVVFDDPPLLHLWEVADIADIPGYSDKLQDILAGYSSFEEFFADNPKSSLVIYKDYLIDCAKQFKVRPALAKKYITVMITGNIPGYSNRESFIKQCNDILGEFIRVKLARSAILSADYLITVNPHSSSVKADKARASGTPIVTPGMFISELRRICLFERSTALEPYKDEEVTADEDG